MKSIRFRWKDIPNDGKEETVSIEKVLKHHLKDKIEKYGLEWSDNDTQAFKKSPDKLSITLDNKGLKTLKNKDRVQWEDKRHKPLDQYFEYDVQDRLYGILTGLTSIMKKLRAAKRIVTEITITNVPKFHEGRIDAILEYYGNHYGKTKVGVACKLVFSKL